MDIEIRRASSEDFEALTRIAHVAKEYESGSEGYTLWKDELTVSREFIDHHLVYCAVRGSEILGFYALSGSTASTWVLEHMWVDFSGGKVLGELFDHMVNMIRAEGGTTVWIAARVASDSEMEDEFYSRMGAKWVRDVPFESETSKHSFLRLDLRDYFASNMLPDQSYLAVPDYTSEADFQAIAQHFESARDVHVVYGGKLPRASFTGVDGPSVIQFMNWMASFSPEQLMQLAGWSLAVYFGKKFIDGFATEAGKSFWNAIISLSKLICRGSTTSQDAQEPERRHFILASYGTAQGAGIYFFVRIILPVPSEELLLLDQFVEVQRYFLPLIGCLAGKSNEVRVNIVPEERSDWPWTVHDIGGKAVFAVNLKERLFDDRSLRIEVPHVSTKECLLALGLKEIEKPESTWTKLKKYFSKRRQSGTK